MIGKRAPLSFIEAASNHAHQGPDNASRHGNQTGNGSRRLVDQLDVVRQQEGVAQRAELDHEKAQQVHAEGFVLENFKVQDRLSQLFGPAQQEAQRAEADKDRKEIGQQLA